MRQKTFMCVDTWANIICENMKVGDEFILVELTNLNGNTTTWVLRPDNGGIGGNVDSKNKRYHGWRGTTNNVSTYAHGVRKIIKLGELEIDDFSGMYCRKVTVGRDIHPDWE